MNFYKFPRTPHLFVLPGLNIRDDKVLERGEEEKFYLRPIIIEEKIDGANVGISFDLNLNLQIQNRNNYVKPGDQPQFESIWEWAYLRSGILQQLLSSRYILFGEWCYAQHSVHYTNLPDWFLGFDVFDKFDNKFFTVRNRNELLDKADLSAVPLIAQKKVNRQQLISIIENATSKYASGSVEGIYLRLESDDKLEARAKVVRRDFIQNIGEHWSKRKIIKNQLVIG